MPGEYEGTTTLTEVHGAGRPCRWTWIDKSIVWFVALVGVVTEVGLVLAPHFLIPEEDAVILFQYSRNLAHTGAITYIQNGVRAEGATDFLWMVAIAIGFKLHIPPYWTVAICNGVSLVFLAWIILRIAGQRLHPIAALFIMGAYGLMPQVAASLVGFSVLPFACLVALMVLFFLRRRDLAMALTALVVCLFRPDGVVFAVPLLIASLIIYDARVRRAIVFGTTFVVPGIIYFLWRWHYFNSPFPLTFLVKSDTQRYAHFFDMSSVMAGAFLCAFAFTLAWVVLRKRGPIPSPTLAILFCLMIMPNLFYFAMRLDQDEGRRFFVYLPLSVAVLIAMNWDWVRSNRAYMLRIGVALWLILMCRMWFMSLAGGFVFQFDNRRAIAIDLGKLPKGSLIVTEAGILPYYSNWVTYDAWGLNTARFSTRLFQPSDVSLIQPDAMMVYAGGDCTRRSDWSIPYTIRTWQNMTRNIVAGTDTAKYALWYVPYGNSRLRAWQGIKPWDGPQECWFVRRSGPLGNKIMDVLARHGGLSADANRAHHLEDQSPPAIQTPAGHADQRRGWVRSTLSGCYRLWRQLGN